MPSTRWLLAVVAGAISMSGLAATIPVPALADCGPSEAIALRDALGQLPVEPTFGVPWSGQPVDSNYDSCADLSSIVVTVEGATGSSPEQALMFHRGRYLGTGTLYAYPFTSIDHTASTNDTVVLRYKDYNSAACTACPAPVTSVRFQWQGDRVVMVDPPPRW
jgi:hypothetical protein